MTEWIVVANQTQARIFKKIYPTQKLKLIKTFTNPLGRVKDKNLLRDKPGSSIRNVGRAKVARGTTSTGRSPHEDAAREFSKKVAAHLDRQNQGHRFDRLIIAAEPRFSGKLKSSLTARTLDLITDWVPKDLDKKSDQELHKIFQTH